MRLGVLTSHPIQYYAPLFRHLAERVDLDVLYAHRPTALQQGGSGFEVPFEWDVDLLSGYQHRFLVNRAKRPGSDHFGGCDTPDVADAIRRARYDALLVTGWYLKTYLQGIFAAKRAGIPVIVRGDSHLTTPRNLAKRLAKGLAYPALLRVFDAALHVGELNRRYFLHYGYPASRLFKAPHCIDTAYFAARGTRENGRALRASLGIAETEQVVLFAGKLVDFKRPLDVVEAVARLSASRPVSLVVAGAGPLEAQVASLARERSVRLHALGFCNQSRMPSIYAAAQVLVLPSTGQETWGLVCNEAIACGTPIVVADAVGCAPDLVLERHAGRMFGLGDIDGLASAIAAVMDLPPSRSCLERVSREHSLAAAAEGVEQALQSVCAR